MGKYFISMTKAMGPIPNTHKEKSWGYGSVAECTGWTIMQTLFRYQHPCNKGGIL